MRESALRLGVLCLLAAFGCGRQGGPGVEQLAAALRAHGVAYDVSETCALTGIEGEGLRLTGPNLAVDLYRIGDERQMQAVVAAAERARTPPQEADTEVQRFYAPSLKCYVRRPFVVIVRREPAEDQVARALAAALSD